MKEVIMAAEWLSQDDYLMTVALLSMTGEQSLIVGSHFAQLSCEKYMINATVTKKTMR
jgi:hypothetical protein